MNYRILAIGKPKLPYAAEGVEEYRKRLQRYASLEVQFLKDRNDSTALLARSEGSYRIALDERGVHHSTAAFAKRLGALEDRGDLKAISFLLGGANGHDPHLRATCDELWSLSALTLQHELALVVLLEQVYRAFTIKRGEPYHRS